MRVLIVGLGVALLATAPVFGYSTTVKLSTPGAVFTPGGGCSGEDAYVIACEDLTAGTFDLNIDITCDDPGGMTSMQMTIQGCDGLAYSAAQVLMGNALNYAGTYAAMAGRAGFVNLGWDQATASSLAWAAGSLPMPGPPAQQVGTICMYDAEFNAIPASNGWAAWMEFVTPDCEDFVCCCMVAPDAYVSDVTFSPTDITVVPLCITPEPASVLLLLLGAPFLRRRRC